MNNSILRSNRSDSLLDPSNDHSYIDKKCLHSALDQRTSGLKCRNSGTLTGGSKFYNVNGFGAGLGGRSSSKLLNMQSIYRKKAAAMEKYLMVNKHQSALKFTSLHHKAANSPNDPTISDNILNASGSGGLSPDAASDILGGMPAVNDGSVVGHNHLCNSSSLQQNSGGCGGSDETQL